MDEDQAREWLLLIHQLPPKPDYLRVKVWRRLQKLGAVAVKNSVYVLPDEPGSLENFQWLAREIESAGGEATLCKAALVGGLSDRNVIKLFNDARSSDYRELAAGIKQHAETGAFVQMSAGIVGTEQSLARFRRRFSEIRAIDFFGAGEATVAEQAILDLENNLQHPNSSGEETVQSHLELKSKIWVTRSGIYVDRMASAWLIRRFIDPQARFKFVTENDYPSRTGEVRFDMFEAEFTHVGDACTFEVLLHLVENPNPALRLISQIIHDIDLRDGKFGRDEAAGLEAVINGIAQSSQDDDQRLEQAIPLFDQLLAHFHKLISTTTLEERADA